ncbi:MAG: hypothetical protein U5L96_10525 [Owenweeksia sp.]|nr:hypothetical protein [Owenweeksia sp.]
MTKLYRSQHHYYPTKKSGDLLHGQWIAIGQSVEYSRAAEGERPMAKDNKTIGRSQLDRISLLPRRGTFLKIEVIL